MYEVRFFKVDKFGYEVGEEKWVAAIKTDFVPRIGDNVAVLSDEDALEVIDVKLYYDADNDETQREFKCGAHYNLTYNPVAEVYLISKDAE